MKVILIWVGMIFIGGPVLFTLVAFIFTAVFEASEENDRESRREAEGEKSRKEYRKSELNYKILVYLRGVIKENIKCVPYEVKSEVPARWLDKTLIKIDKWNMTVTEIGRDGVKKAKIIKNYSDFGYEKLEWDYYWSSFLAEDLKRDFGYLNVKSGSFKIDEEYYQISIEYKREYDKHSPYNK